MATIEARGIRQVYGRRANEQVIALNGVDLDIDRGESLGIVGESGSGKSTLARILTGLERPTEGAIRIDGKEPPAGGREWRATRRQLQLIPQHAGGALDPRVTVEQHLREVIDAHELASGRAAKVKLIQDSLSKVGIPPEHRIKRPRQLSGGQQQRVIIARSLLLSPAILFADEPTSALDLLVQRQIVNLLNDTCRGPERVFAIVTHDLRIVEGLCDRLVVMKGGEIVESGTTDAVLNRPSHPYTRELIAAAFDTAQASTEGGAES